MSLFLGTARELITPKVGACLYGYKPDWHSTSIADDLTAIAFYFKSEDTEALWYYSDGTIVYSDGIDALLTR